MPNLLFFSEEDSDDEFQKMLNEDQHNLEIINDENLTAKHIVSLFLIHLPCSV